MILSRSDIVKYFHSHLVKLIQIYSVILFKYSDVTLVLQIS